MEGVIGTLRRRRCHRSKTKKRSKPLIADKITTIKKSVVMPFIIKEQKP